MSSNAARAWAWRATEAKFAGEQDIALDLCGDCIGRGHALRRFHVQPRSFCRTRYAVFADRTQSE